MASIHKLGTWVRMPDGREGTVVYNSLVGVGIKWGLHNPDPADFERTDGNTLHGGVPEGFVWEPDALLRDAKMTSLLGMECVGEEWEIIGPPDRAEKETLDTPPAE